MVGGRDNLKVIDELKTGETGSPCAAPDVRGAKGEVRRFGATREVGTEARKKSPAVAKQNVT